MELTRDLHIHTMFSGHSKADMATGSIVKQAQSAGLTQILILEHVPDIPAFTPAVTDKRLREAPRRTLDAVVHEVSQWRENSPVEILIGAEVDPDPHQRDGRLLLNDYSGIDVVVVGAHFLPGSGRPWFDPVPVDPMMRETIFWQWLGWIQTVMTNPAVRIFAHPGLAMCRIGAIESFDSEILDAFTPLLETMQAHGVAFELNEGMKRRLTPAQLETYIDLCRLAKETGVRFTTGSDAHALKKVGRFRFVAALCEALALGEDDFATLTPRNA